MNLLKTVTLREVMAVVVFCFGLGGWVQSWRHDTSDLQRQITELRDRVDRGERAVRDTYVRADVLQPTLKSIDDRVRNIETYMRRITQ